MSKANTVSRQTRFQWLIDAAVFLSGISAGCCPSTALMNFLPRWKQIFNPRQLLQELGWYSI